MTKTIILLLLATTLCATVGVSNITDTSEIKRNGYYNTHDTTWCENCGQRDFEYFGSIDIYIFYDSSKVFYKGRSASYGSPVLDDEYTLREGPKMVGSYFVHNDSIFASIPTQFLMHAQKYKYFEAHFSGKFKNSDTIIGWKMIPPYPKIKLRFNKFFHQDTTPKMLHFVKYDKVESFTQFLNTH